MHLGDKINAENKCNLILKVNPNNDFGSCTLAELLL